MVFSLVLVAFLSNTVQHTVTVVHLIVICLKFFALFLQSLKLSVSLDCFIFLLLYFFPLPAILVLPSQPGNGQSWHGSLVSCCKHGIQEQETRNMRSWVCSGCLPTIRSPSAGFAVGGDRKGEQAGGGGDRVMRSRWSIPTRL